MQQTQFWRRDAAAEISRKPMALARQGRLLRASSLATRQNFSKPVESSFTRARRWTNGRLPRSALRSGQPLTLRASDLRAPDDERAASAQCESDPQNNEMLGGSHDLDSAKPAEDQGKIESGSDQPWSSLEDRPALRFLGRLHVGREGPHAEKRKRPPAMKLTREL